MKAVVLAAGRGTRLQPATEEGPKPLIKVGGRSILLDCLSQLRPLAAEEYLIVVGYRADAVRAHVGRRFDGVPVRYVRQRRLAGPAFALPPALDHLEEPFVLLYGDSLYRMDVLAPVRRFTESGCDALVVVDRPFSEDTTAGGVAAPQVGSGEGAQETRDASDSRAGWTAAGFFVLSASIRHAVDLLPEEASEERDVAHLLRTWQAKGAAVVTHQLDGWRANVNSPADLRRARERLGG